MSYRNTETNIIQEINDFNDIATCSDWLWSQLLSLYSSQNGELFDYLHKSRAESVSDGINLIYEKITPDAQTLLRQSIGEVFEVHGSDEIAPPNLFEDLIYLIAGIEAEGSLASLTATIGNGNLGKNHPELLYSTMAVLKTLSPSPIIQETVSDLVNSSNFDDGYIIEAIGILSECNPGSALSNLEQYRPRITKLHKLTKESGKKEEAMFNDCVQDLFEQIQQLNPTIDQDLMRQILNG